MSVFCVCSLFKPPTKNTSRQSLFDSMVSFLLRAGNVGILEYRKPQGASMGFYMCACQNKGPLKKMVVFLCSLFKPPKGYPLKKDTGPHLEF